MASPTIESLCCRMSYNASSGDLIEEVYTLPYNLTSISASVFGIGGALYQLIQRVSYRASNGQRRFLTGAPKRNCLKTHGRQLVKWLTVADLLAAIGILIRSLIWLVEQPTVTGYSDTIEEKKIFCILSSVWIHYFYTATYFWTFLYALDVVLIVKNKRIDFRMYHIFGWVAPGILCLIGLLFLYLPDLNCNSIHINPYLRFLPNYLSTFVPIVIIMTLNPVLYITAFSSVGSLIASFRGRFTQPERELVRKLKSKFFWINVVFYICWLPNIVNGILLWSLGDLPNPIIIGIWYSMAVLNPLQAVLNCFVYHNWDSGTCSCEFLNFSSCRQRITNTSDPGSQVTSGAQMTQESQNALHFGRNAIANEMTPLLYPLK